MGGNLKKNVKQEFKNRWCGRGDLNPHTRNALPPQGSVSTVPPRPRKRKFSSRSLRERKMNLRSQIWVSVKSDKSDNKCINNLRFDHSKSDEHSCHQFSAKTRVTSCTSDSCSSSATHTDFSTKSSQTKTNTRSDHRIRFQCLVSNVCRCSSRSRCRFNSSFNNRYRFFSTEY